MDHQNYNYNRPAPAENKRRSAHMERAAFFLGIISISTICLVYPAFICGSLAIVFALLSRGGEMTLTTRSKIGLTFGAIALGIVALMFVYVFVMANTYYNGLEDMMRQVYGSMGIDFDLLMKNAMR